MWEFLIIKLRLSLFLSSQELDKYEFQSIAREVKEFGKRCLFICLAHLFLTCYFLCNIYT